MARGKKKPSVSFGTPRVFVFLGRIAVWDVAWGRDIGDDFDHVTSNVSPGPATEHTIDFFFTNEIVGIIPDTGATLFPDSAGRCVVPIVR